MIYTEDLIEKEKRLRAWEESLKSWAQLKNIVEIKWGDSIPEGDLLIRVVRDRFKTSSKFDEIKPEQCEFTVLQSGAEGEEKK